MATDDALTRAIAEALDEAFPNGPWVVYPDTDGCNSVRGATNDEIAAAIAPLIEARVREARAEELTDAAIAAREMHDPPEPECVEWADWLLARAVEVRRG